MKKLMIAGALLSVATAAPVAAQTTYFNFKGGNSPTTGTIGNSRTYTSNGITVTATAWSLSTPTGAPTAAYLGAYDAGLGVTNINEDGSYPGHTIDNQGSYDFVTLTFSTAVQLLYGQLTPFAISNTAPKDNDSSVSFTTDKAMGPITQPFLWTDLKLHTTEVLGNLNTYQNSNYDYWTYLNPGMNTGNIWTIGADRVNIADPNRDDAFKLSGITVQIPTPEPANWALMIAGFGLVGGAMRRRAGRTTTSVSFA